MTQLTQKPTIPVPALPQLLHLHDSTSILLTSSTSNSDISSYYDSDMNNQNHNDNLHSQLSIQTLPSVPSLQSSPLFQLPYPSPITTFISASPYSTTIKSNTTTTSSVTSLYLSDTHLYAASSHHITIYDSTTLTHIHSFNSNVSITNPSTTTITKTISPSASGSVKSIIFTNKNIFTAHQDGKIRVWKNKDKRNLPADQINLKLVTTLPTLNDRLLRFPLPNNYQQVRRHKKSLWIQHHDAVTSLATHNNLIYSVSWDKSLKIWRAKDFKCLQSIVAHDDAINAVIVNPQDGTVFTGSTDRKIKLWLLQAAPNTTTSTIADKKDIDEKRNRGSHGQHHQQQKGKGKVQLVATLEKHRSGVNALALSSDGSILFSGACDRSILVWEKTKKKTNKANNFLQLGHGHVDHDVVVGSDDEDINSYMEVSGALRGHDGAILSLINVSDFLISGSEDRTVRIWRKGFDAANGSTINSGQRFCCLTVLRGHVKPVKCLTAEWDAGKEGDRVNKSGGSISGGVIRVFSGSLDGEIKVWKVKVFGDL